jgi:hypothetical protein
MTDWVTPQQVSAKTKVYVTEVRRALERGELHGHQKCAGGRWRVDPACVDPWVAGLDSESACCCRSLRTARRAS